MWPSEGQGEYRLAHLHCSMEAHVDPILTFSNALSLVIGMGDSYLVCRGRGVGRPIWRAKSATLCAQFAIFGRNSPGGLMEIVPHPLLLFDKGVTELMSIDDANCCCCGCILHAHTLELPSNAPGQICAI